MHNLTTCGWLWALICIFSIVCFCKRVWSIKLSPFGFQNLSDFCRRCPRIDLQPVQHYELDLLILKNSIKRFPVSFLLTLFQKKEKNCCGQTIYCGTPWARDSNYGNIKYQQNKKLKMSSDFNTTYNASLMQTRLNISASTSQKILCNSNTTNRHQLWSNHSSKNAESYKILIIGIAPFQVHIFDTKFLAKLSWRLHNGGLRYQQHRNKENN